MKAKLIFSTLFLSILITGVLNAQQTIDFENNGSNLIWSEMANDGIAPQIIDNPYNDANNPSAKVLHFNLLNNANSKPWAGTWVDVDKFIVAGNGLIRLKVYKPLVSQIGFKLEAGSQGNGEALELKKGNVEIDTWETVVFDFSERLGSDYSRLVIMPDFSDPRAQDTDVYVDDIEFFHTATSLEKMQIEGAKLFVSDKILLINSSIRISELMVYDLSGAMVQCSRCPVNEVSLQGLRDGIYIVQIKAGELSNTYKIKI